LLSGPPKAREKEVVFGCIYRRRFYLKVGSDIEYLSKLAAKTIGHLALSIVSVKTTYI